MKCSDEISIGDYVRTDKGIITKAQEHFIDSLLNGKSAFGKAVKHSKNIINLIEKGDVIEINNKKYEVIFDKSYEKLGLLIPNREHLAIRHCSLDYIFSNEGRKEFESISIITKEQMKQIEYRIKEQ